MSKSIATPGVARVTAGAGLRRRLVRRQEY